MNQLIKGSDHTNEAEVDVHAAWHAQAKKLFEILRGYLSKIEKS